MTTATKTVRVGQMPGRIEEFAVAVGTPLSALISLANLSASGYDVKVDGNLVTDLETPVTSSTNLVILAKQVKGNAQRELRVGQMPGRIETYAVDSEQTVAQVLELAGLNAAGFDVKVDGNLVTNLSQAVGSANLIILAKQVKGNQGYADVTKNVRVGQMPGRIEEFVVSEGASIADVLALAGLNPAGFDVKVDGNLVTDLNGAKVTQSTNLIILAKQVKGNVTREVRVGQMPGRIDTYAVDSEQTIADLIAIAGLSNTGFDVKVDGNLVTDLSAKVNTANLVILAKQVKGNEI